MRKLIKHINGLILFKFPTKFSIVLTKLLFSRIPEERQLAAVAKAAVAKPSPLAAKLGNPDAPELFESLVPVAVHQALAAYELRKTEIVNKEVDKLKEATNLANQLLSSMNLPAALEDTKGKKTSIFQRRILLILSQSIVYSLFP